VRWLWLGDEPWLGVVRGLGERMEEYIARMAAQRCGNFGTARVKRQQSLG
jgi:hypothetical protein